MNKLATLPGLANNNYHTPDQTVENRLIIAPEIN